MKKTFLLLILLGVAAAAFAYRHFFPAPPAWQGYAEGEYVRIASQWPGTLEKLHVARGDSIAVGTPLFQLESEKERSLLEEARHRVETARSTRDRTRGSFAANSVSAMEMDKAELDYRTAAEQVLQREWDLRQKNPAAAADAVVFDTYYREGEWVPAGSPVVSLLPPANRLVRFYVPGPGLHGFRQGQPVALHLPGRPEPLRATVSFISPEAELTPPVIFSRQTAAKLVFRLEARPADPADATALQPGQPVEVRPLPDEP